MSESVIDSVRRAVSLQYVGSLHWLCAEGRNVNVVLTGVGVYSDNLIEMDGMQKKNLEYANVQN